MHVPTSLLLPLLLFLALRSTPPTRASPSLRSVLHRFQNYTRISHFRLLNRKDVVSCPRGNSPYLDVRVRTVRPGVLLDEENVTVTVSGVVSPDESDWVAIISPSNSTVADCPLSSLLYKQTGDFSNLPLLCNYPVKAQYLKNDPSYLSCNKNQCKEKKNGVCTSLACSGSITFNVVNFRSEVVFVFLTGGFSTPCLLKTSRPLKFATPKKPLHGHLSSVDSTGTTMRLTWVSGDSLPQQVIYANGKSATSNVTTFTQADMCGDGVVASPAQDFGWHDPGFIHSAVMTGLRPQAMNTYKYGSKTVGWSKEINFRSPPAVGAEELVFIAYGDMGKAPLDKSSEHYIQLGSRSVVQAITAEVDTQKIDSIFHIGDISYATGFLVEWDYFLKMIEPAASRVSYMTAIGNHERDYVKSGSLYVTPDSGGECGVPYETYFPMPTSGKDKPWYSIEQANVHFTVMSTEHSWHENSEQYDWIKKDLQSVNRIRTPWLIFMGHRPMYVSDSGVIPSVDPFFVKEVEPLLMDNKVDLAFFGHVHNYERTCAIYRGECKDIPIKEKDGIYTYDGRNYSAPVHVVMGMAGFTLDKFSSNHASWSLSRISEFGYVKVQVKRKCLNLKLVNAKTRAVEDRFRIIKS